MKKLKEVIAMKELPQQTQTQAQLGGETQQAKSFEGCENITKEVVPLGGV